MSKATEDDLGGLHGQLARTLTGMIQVRTRIKVDKEGNQVEEEVEPSPAALAVAAKFLKDNNITAAPSQSTDVEDLEKSLAERRRKAKERGRVSRADLNAAMGKLGTELLQ